MNTNTTTIAITVGALWGANIFMGPAARAANDKIINSFPAPSPNSYGLAYGNDILFVSDRESKAIYRLNPDTGSVLSSYKPTPQPAGKIPGLGFANKRLWCTGVQPDNTRLYRMRPATGSVEASYAVPGIKAGDGAAAYGAYVYVSDNSPVNHFVFKFHPASGTIVNTWAGAKFPGGLTAITHLPTNNKVVLNIGTVDGWVYIYGLDGYRYEGQQFNIDVPCPECHFTGDLATRNDTHIFFASDYFDYIYELYIDWWAQERPVDPASLGSVKALFR
jgi:outer membrane protein assembly factor BamB